MNFEHSQKHTHDADEQAASMHNWNQRYEQLSAGRFDGVVQELRVGPAQVFAESANQVVMQVGHMRPDRRSIALVRAGGAPGWYCGHQLSGEHLIGISCQGDFDLVASADMHILALSVDTQALRTLSAQLDGPDAELPDVPTMLCLPPTALNQVRALLEAALSLGRDTSHNGAGHAAARRMLMLSLCDALLGCIGHGASIGTSALPASAASRRRIVGRARQYMQTHAHEVIAIPDLCQAIGTSRRALQYAFEEVMQISPITYLRAMRLNRVRSELRQSPDSTVGDVAARWGFWHPSRFASEYKALFGELPSATRKAVNM